MSAAGTKLSKKSVTARSDGRTPAPRSLDNSALHTVPEDGITASHVKVSQERDRKLAEARAALAAKDAAAKALDTEAIADAVVKSKPKAKKIPATLNLVPTPKASRVQPAGTAAAKAAAKKPAVKPAPATNGSVPAGSKKCSKCGQVKELNTENWAKDRSNVTGFYGQCKSCEKAWREAKKAAATAPTAA